MRRRRLFIILIAIFILLGGGVWYLSAQLSAPPPAGFTWEEDEFYAEATENPQIKDAVSITISPSQPQTESPPAPPSGEVLTDLSSPEPLIIHETRTIVMYANDKKIGEEEYQLRTLPNGYLRLRSTGHFVFKIVVVETKFHFKQEMIWDQDYGPISASFEFRGPLGVGNRNMSMKFMGEDPYRSAIVTSGDDEKQVQLPDGILALQGTLGSYAVLPHLINQREHLEVEMIFAGGFSGGPDSRESQELGASHTEIEFVKQNPVFIKSGEMLLEMEHYLMRNPRRGTQSGGGMHLLFYKNQFAAAYARSEGSDDGDEGEFIVYSSDIFQDGFEIVESN